MTGELLAMSQTELTRLEIVQRSKDERLKQVDAARLLGLSTRQIRKLQRQYERCGAAGLTSKRRGKPSNNHLREGVKAQAIALVQAHYPDFGPTFAHEKLTECHGLSLSRETLRQLMIKANLWQVKGRQQVHIHPSRPRRSCRGELVQLDGSPHDWFEGRAPKCCLIVLVDDATSELMQLHFVEQECTQGYFDAIVAHLKRDGRPLTYYSDRHNIFRVNIKEAESGTGDTQLGRALKQLDIELICAHSPQAKGRVERANQTLQDRLVKELRLNKISDIKAANEYLPTFTDNYNRRFAKPAANASDTHRALTMTEDELRKILCHQHQRKTSKNLELSYNNITYQITANSPNRMRGTSITVCDDRGDVTLIYKGKELKYQTIDKHNQPTPIKDSKQVQTPKWNRKSKPSQTHPWRKECQLRMINQAVATKKT